MEQGAEKILAKHGCLYMKDDYKALFEELEAYYKPTEAVKNNAVFPFVSGSYYWVKCFTDDVSYEPAIASDYYQNGTMYFKFLNGAIRECSRIADYKELNYR